MMAQQLTAVSQSRRRKLRLHSAVSLFFLMATMDALSFLSRLVYGEWSGKGGDKITQSINLLLVMADFFLFYRGFRAVRTFKVGVAIALATAAFFLCSAAWSLDPETSIRRGILYILFLLGIIGVSANSEPDEFMGLVQLACFIPAVVSAVLLVVWPHGVLADGGELRGVFSHKNVLGQVMAIGTLASLHALRVGRGPRYRNILMLLLFVALVMLSRSTTSLMEAVVFCAASLAITLFRLGGAARVASIALTVIFAPAAIFTAASPDFFLEMLGKSPTLTGRTDLWGYVLSYIGQKPLLGWGFAAFWSGDSLPALQISDTLGWVVPEAHNALLEMLIEVGWVGTSLLLILFFRNILLAVRCLNSPLTEFAASSLLCYGGLILVGITEEVLVDPNQSAVSIFFATGFMCERALNARRRHRVHAGPGQIMPAYTNIAAGRGLEAKQTYAGR